MEELNIRLRQAREGVRFAQDDVGASLGISRAMVSYWESGRRRPNDRQLAALAHLYGVSLVELVEGSAANFAASDVDLSGMLLRADDGVDPQAAPGVRDFVQFLDNYAELSDLVRQPVHGMTQSPYVHRPRFTQKDDARRKAEEVRSLLDLGIAPIIDLDSVCNRLRITVYRAPLGADLGKVPSGAFLDHPKVGFAVLVNLDMTPGRRRFTVAHEIAHALFDSGDVRWVVSHGRNAREDFADEFAGEFLMPSEGVRRFLEESEMPPRLTSAVDVIHVQRHFRVSFPTALVRLRQMNAITAASYRELRQGVRPVAMARLLGYAIDPEEYQQDAGAWGIRRFPRAFLRMLRTGVLGEVISRSSAAALAGMSLPELVQVTGEPPAETDEGPEAALAVEFSEFEDSGVIGR